MNYVNIPYWGATLTAPEFLAPLWPIDLSPERWPTFCGAGDGLGDRIVPDSICGVRISAACFIHDIDWATSPDTFQEFMAANGRLFLNSTAIILASDLTVWRKIRAIHRAAAAYLFAVCTVGKLFFKWSDDDRAMTTDPYHHPIVKARLKRLAQADMGLTDETDPRQLAGKNKG